MTDSISNDNSPASTLPGDQISSAACFNGHSSDNDSATDVCRRKISVVLWLSAILMFGLLILSRSGADPDLWGHVTYGREVIRDGHLHPTTTWSYAVEGYRWINHENIAELVMAAADLAGGQTALLLVKSLLTLILLGVPLWAAWRQGAGIVTCFFITTLLALNISFHWLVRPHMFSYACAAGLIALLTMFLPGGLTSRPGVKDRSEPLIFSRWLWLIPPLMCFWTNAHGGFLAGMAILAAWLGLDALELIAEPFLPVLQRRLQPLFSGLRRQNDSEPDSTSAIVYRDRWKTDVIRTIRHHAILFSVTVAACLCNPYGTELPLWMLSSLGRPRPEICEWAPLPLLSEDALPFWGLALTAMIALSRTTHPIRWPGFIVTGLLTWQALSHYRHLPFVAIMCSFLLTPHIEQQVRRYQRWSRERLASLRSGSTIRKQRPAILLPGLLVAGLAAAIYPRTAQLNVDQSYYPVSAMQYMTDHRLDGRVFVTFNWAQYALAVFANSSRESRIAFDGRFRTCYPQSIIDMYFDFTLGDLPKHIRYREDASGEFDPTQALSYGNPDLVLFERFRKNCTRVMEDANDEWCLLYQDSLAQLWGRRSQFDDPTSAEYLPPEHRHITDDLQEGAVAWPGFPVVRSSASSVAAAHPAVRL
ncbi:MAG: hypothetical protein KDA81_17450 [Planctomycetaceae bacterium]|nr:hypothetical protein [Planctomycetaceae bacterium]